MVIIETNGLQTSAHTTLKELRKNIFLFVYFPNIFLWVFSNIQKSWSNWAVNNIYTPPKFYYKHFALVTSVHLSIYLIFYTFPNKFLTPVHFTPKFFGMRNMNYSSYICLYFSFFLEIKFTSMKCTNLKYTIWWFLTDDFAFLTPNSVKV